MSYRDDLQAALSRLDAVERDLAVARADGARAEHERAEAQAALGKATAELASLRAENAALERLRYAPSMAERARLVAGLVVAGAAAFDLVASYGTINGKPPALGLEAGPVAAVGALVAALVVGLGRLRVAGQASMLLVGALLVAKPWVAPVTWSWDDMHGTFNITSETHLYFLLSGIAAIVVATFMIGGTWDRDRPRDPPRPSG